MNVVHIRQFDGNRLIEAFVSRNKSENTKDSYRRTLKQFFAEIKHKDISLLNERDLRFDLDDIEMYTEFLKSKGDKPRTINTKLSTLKNFISYLSARTKRFGIDPINTDFLNAIEKEKHSDDEGQYGALEVSEIEMMVKLAMGEQRKPEIKSYFIRFALETALRKEELLNIKWSSFGLKDNGNYHFSVKGKGEVTHHRDVSPKVYNELLQFKNNDSKRAEYVFNLTNDEVNYLIRNLLKILDIPKERNIVFHSIRKTAITEFYKLNKDIEETRIYAGHKNIKTTQRYIKLKETESLGYYSMREELLNSRIDELSREELLKIIKSEDDIHRRILRKMSK